MSGRGNILGWDEEVNKAPSVAVAALLSPCGCACGLPASPARLSPLPSPPVAAPAWVFSFCMKNFWCPIECFFTSKAVFDTNKKINYITRLEITRRIY
jgi:hypothetical protein